MPVLSQHPKAKYSIKQIRDAISGLLQSKYLYECIKEPGLFIATMTAEMMGLPEHSLSVVENGTDWATYIEFDSPLEEGFKMRFDLI